MSGALVTLPKSFALFTDGPACGCVRPLPYHRPDLIHAQHPDGYPVFYRLRRAYTDRGLSLCCYSLVRPKP